MKSQEIKMIPVHLEDFMAINSIVTKTFHLDIHGDQECNVVVEIFSLDQSDMLITIVIPSITMAKTKFMCNILYNKVLTHNSGVFLSVEQNCNNMLILL